MEHIVHCSENGPLERTKLATMYNSASNIYGKHCSLKTYFQCCEHFHVTHPFKEHIHIALNLKVDYRLSNQSDKDL